MEGVVTESQAPADVSEHLFPSVALRSSSCLGALLHLFRGAARCRPLTPRPGESNRRVTALKAARSASLLSSHAPHETATLQ